MCVIDKIIFSTQKSSGLTTYVNPYSYFLLRKNRIVSHFDCVHVDGILLVILLNFFLGSKVKRKSFDMTSMAADVFNDAVLNRKTVCLIGSKKDEIEKAKENIKKHFKGISIVCFRDGYFLDHEREIYIDELLKIRPSIVVVGMGTPLQEKFLIELQHKGWNGAGYTCGGFIHQTAKDINYYPRILNSLNLRWLYRIYKDPKLIYRYFIIYPIAVLFVIKDVVKYRVTKSNK